MAEVRAIGQKFWGEEAHPPIEMSLILAWHHDSGIDCVSTTILVNRVARK